jgi:hypothetical protein
MIRWTSRTHKILSILILVALLLSACGQPTPQPAEPAATQPLVATLGSVLTTTPQPPVATPVPAASPVPTLTPMPLPAPQLLSRSPAPGEEQPLDAPLELTFDEPMDQASVEAAFTISPTIEGKFTWVNDRTFDFAPISQQGGASAAGFQRGVRYSVRIAVTARNIEGKPLEEAVAFDFSTVG